jgi:sensor domain CHASE-containing protein
LGESVHNVKENAEALLVATKEIGLEVNAGNTKYMVMSRDRNAGRNDSVKIDNSSIERVEEFKYLGKILTDQNSVQDEIRSRLKLGNVLLSFGAESVVFQVAFQTLKDQDI